MEIDTLILSGNAEKSISFIGSIYALYNKNIIKKKFKNIKEIVCVSGGALVITFILIFLFNNYNFKQIIKLNLELDVNPSFDKDDLNIDDAIKYMGLYNNDDLVKYLKKYIYLRYKKDDLNLKELYNIIPIKISYKVYNLSDNKIEYINYLNNPNFSLLNLLKATTCLPLIFKPIYYNNKYYIDGGIYCSTPIDYPKSKKYICLIYKSRKKIYPNISIQDYIKLLVSSANDPIIKDNYFKNNKKIIYIKLNLNTSILHTINDKKYMIIEGYNQTINYLNNLNNN